MYFFFFFVDVLPQRSTAPHWLSRHIDHISMRSAKSHRMHDQHRKWPKCETEWFVFLNVISMHFHRDGVFCATATSVPHRSSRDASQFSFNGNSLEIVVQSIGHQQQFIHFITVHCPAVQQSEKRKTNLAAHIARLRGMLVMKMILLQMKTDWSHSQFRFGMLVGSTDRHWQNEKKKKILSASISSKKF